MCVVQRADDVVECVDVGVACVGEYGGCADVGGDGIGGGGGVAADHQSE